MRARAFILITACIAASCASFAAEGGGGGETDTTPSDAGADRVTSAPRDAGLDADLDAGPTLPADAFAMLAFEKDEFDNFEDRDDPSGGPLGWSDKTSGTNAPDNALVACEGDVCSKDDVALCENNSTGSGFLSTKLASTTRVMRFDFAMKIDVDAHNSQAQAQVVSIQIEGDRFIFLEYYEGGFRLGDQFRPAPEKDYDTAFTQLGPVPSGWAKYRLYLDLNLGLVALAQDGALTGSVRVLRPEAIGNLQEVRIGITYAQHDNFHVAFDDVGLKQHDK